jgi:hypothetical protein
MKKCVAIPFIGMVPVYLDAGRGLGGWPPVEAIRGQIIDCFKLRGIVEARGAAFTMAIF